MFFKNIKIFSINELKTIFENINKSKEELKLYVQKIFTKIRSAINEREDELLLEIDNKYNELQYAELIYLNIIYLLISSQLFLIL